METKKVFSYGTSLLTLTRRITYSAEKAHFREHNHINIEIVLCISGTHGYVVDGKTITMHSGDIIAISPGVPHRVLVDDGSYDRYSVIIHPSMLPHGALEEFAASYILKKSSKEEKIYRLLKKAELYAAELPSEAQAVIFPALALEIYYLIVRSERSGNTTESDLINRAIAYIDEHCTEISGISEISDYLYISKSYFHSLFKDHLHKTPHAYLNERKLHLARARILSGERPTDVYGECGFCDYTSFYRAYKKLYGHAPSDIARAGYVDNEF